MVPPFDSSRKNCATIVPFLTIISSGVDFMRKKLQVKLHLAEFCRTSKENLPMLFKFSVNSLKMRGIYAQLCLIKLTPSYDFPIMIEAFEWN